MRKRSSRLRKTISSPRKRLQSISKNLIFQNSSQKGYHQKDDSGLYSHEIQALQFGAQPVLEVQKHPADPVRGEIPCKTDPSGEILGQNDPPS